MAFEINDRVIPLVDLTFSGEPIHTEGVSGTVTQRQQTSTTAAGEPIYSYHVNLDEQPLIGSGTEVAPGTLYWFTGAEVGDFTGVNTDPLVDQAGVQQTLTTSQSSAQTALSSVTQILSNVQEISPYFDSIKKFHGLIQNHADTLNSTTTDGNTDGELRNVGVLSDSLGTDVVVMQEISENLYGFYSVVTELEEELTTEQAQAKVQQALAYEDDALNQKAYTDTFVEGAQSALSLVPDTEGNIPVTPLPDPEPELDELLTPSLILETDE